MDVARASLDLYGRRPDRVVDAQLHLARAAGNGELEEAQAVGGPVHWQTPDFHGASDRYVLTFLGGADRLTIRAATS